MRVNYYYDGIVRVLYTSPPRPDPDTQPRVFVSPETPATFEDTRAIVRHVAMQILKINFNFTGDGLRMAYPELKGISDADIQAVIDKELA